MFYSKIVGAGFILTASLWGGFHAAMRLRHAHKTLRELSVALELISIEIAFSSAPFVPLCCRAGEGRCETVQNFFNSLAREAENADCLYDGLTRRACKDAGLTLPELAVSALERLFDGFGRFDRDGQLSQLHMATQELEKLSNELYEQMDGRCRSYEIVGLTVGAAVVIMVL